ncbi:MAG: stage II sporulation protein M [Candidatus Dormibacteria bacterium]
MRSWLGRHLFTGARAPRREYVWLIARRELRESTSDTRLFIAMTSLTFVIPLVAAGGVTLATHYLGTSAHGIAERLAEVGAFFVVFLPASFSLVLALESFSGERERNTLETLFATQLRESEIYLGKISAVLLPSLTLSYSALVVYTIAIFFTAGFFPGDELPPLVIVTLAQAAVMVTGATIVSSQTKTLRSANVMASFIIIPMSGVIQGESVLIISRLEWVLWGVAVMLATVAVLLLRLGILNFNRENILSKDSRPPDRRGFARKLFVGLPTSPRSVGGWLGRQSRAVPGAYRRTIPAIAVSAGLLIFGGIVGGFAAVSGLLPTGIISGAVRSAAAGNEVVSGSPHLAGFIFSHNVLVGAVMLAFAPVSLGVIGGLLMMVNGFVVGYLGGYYFQVHHLGFFACGIGPHGIFEIPALVFAYAFALRVGASMVRPSPDGWLAGMRLALADYGRGAMFFVPLFAVAAIVEAYVTTTVIRAC